MRLEEKLAILADAAKYDVSCASSGSRRRNSGRLGTAAPSGVCHSYTEDGRCVSLLKILYTNVCIYDCAYCVNRCSNDIPRTAFTPAEIVSLTIDFYRRNYIEGLFLSSGVMRSPDDTMERLVRSVQDLRRQGFNGYIHLKCVPHASSRLVRQAGRHSDRLSVNIELPSEESLKRLAAAKTYPSVLTPMGVIRDAIAETRADRRRLRHVPSFAPAGQSTQLIVGASPESDYDILHLSQRLYRRQSLKRVYYSAYLPVDGTSPRLPAVAEPPLQRENRLYQADWLIRLYGFALDEVISRTSPHLDLNIDPKQAFALRNPAFFPVDINTADREMLLKVPGIGFKSADRIVALRRQGRIRLEHLKLMGVVVTRALAFIRCDGLPAMQWSAAAATGRLASPQESEDVDHFLPPAEGLNRLVFETDATFEGLLTAIFEAYAGMRPPDAIEPAQSGQRTLFERRVSITTEAGKAERVWKGLGRHLGSLRRRQLFEAYLSGRRGVETLIFRMVWDTVGHGRRRKNGTHLTAHLQIDQLAQKVRREAHRVKGFVRFRQTRENHFLALIAPRYDVLPLVRRHFESRFADQQWIIYDTDRNYGLCYDRQQTRELQLGAEKLTSPGEAAAERLCQTLWQRYYAAANIQQRNNPRLHLRQLPRRYWRYLTEKQPQPPAGVKSSRA